MDVHLTGILAELGIGAETAVARGLNAFSNGELVAVAVAGGFECLLTRDRIFGESSRALRVHSEFAVVLITLPQQRWPEYRQQFLQAWAVSPLTA